MTHTATLPRIRRVQRRFAGMPASDGAGVKLTRVIGRPGLEELDPFLLLDEFGSDKGADYIAGFPDHPHRGFETVTYMLAGRMRHGDNQGNVGLLGPGSVQWMTAGRGIVHSEMPEQEEGLMAGFQLWVNLPAKDKMTTPRYQDIPPEDIPVVDAGGGARVKVIAGQVGGTKGAVDTGATEPTYLDIHLEAGGSYTHPIPAGHNAFVYVHDGRAAVGTEGAETPVARGEIAVLGDGDAVRVAAVDGSARLLLIAGKPLREPIARHGPFLINTMAEIRQAVEDYMAGRFCPVGLGRTAEGPADSGSAAARRVRHSRRGIFACRSGASILLLLRRLGNPDTSNGGSHGGDGTASGRGRSGALHERGGGTGR